MPAQYTHQILAERILGALPENVREKITDQTAYFIGAQGGDVFYFLRVFDGKTENLGKYMHNEEISSFFNSLCARASEGGTALSYALGYVTHYAVDIVFHPYVYGQTEFFIGQPGALSPQLIRNMAAEAGMQPLLDSDDLLVYGGGLLTVCASLGDGIRKIRLPDGIRDVIPLTSHKILRNDGKTFEVDIPDAETAVFLLK